MKRAEMTQECNITVTIQYTDTEDMSEYLHTVYTALCVVLGLWMCSLRSL